MTELVERDEGRSLVDLARDLLADNDEGAEVFLGQAWLARTVGDLVAARRRAGLTQEDVARRMNTKQAVISRLENDFEGTCALHRYLAYAQAVGMQPLDIALEPLEAVRSYALAQPDAPRNQIAYSGWCTTVKSQELEQVYTPNRGRGDLLTLANQFLCHVPYQTTQPTGNSTGVSTPLAHLSQGQQFASSGQVLLGTPLPQTALYWRGGYEKALTYPPISVEAQGTKPVVNNRGEASPSSVHDMPAQEGVAA